MKGCCNSGEQSPSLIGKRVAAIKMHDLVQKQIYGQRDQKDIGLSVDTILFSVSIVYFYSMQFKSLL